MTRMSHQVLDSQTGKLPLEAKTPLRCPRFPRELHRYALFDAFINTKNQHNLTACQITSQPIEVRRKAPLVRRTKPQQTMPHRPLTPIVNRPRGLLVKRAGPPSASYPVAICKTPAPSQAMLSTGPGVDYSAPCLGAYNQENIQPIDSAAGFKRYYHEVDSTSDGECVDDSSAEVYRDDDTASDEFNTPGTKKIKRATQANLNLHRRRVVEHARAHLYAKLATQKAGPFPASLVQDTVLADAWLLGFSEVSGDLRLDPMMEPAENDLAVVRTA